jgi:uncharacterized RDD family membrane protein YckC
MTAEPSYALAPIRRRACAWLLDITLGGVLAFGFVDLTGGAHDLSTVWHLVAFKSVNGTSGHQLSAAMNPSAAHLSALKPLLGLLAIMAVIAAVGVAYRVVTTAKWGAGIGKTLLGLRVVVDDPDRAGLQAPGWARAWKRWLVPQAPGLLPLPATSLLAYLPAMRDPRRRGLHDRAAGTIVIDVRRQPAEPEPQSSPLWALSSLDGYLPEPATASARVATTI